MRRLFILSIIAAIIMTGCGSTEGTLNTSMATATLGTVLLDSDVAKWTSGPPVCTGGSTPAPDDVNATVTVTSYANSTGKSLPVRIEKATIYYTPANSVTPSISPVYQAIGQVVQPGSSLTIPVRVATTELKEQFQPTLACASPIYNYYVNVVFDLSEIGGKSTSITTSMQLRFADWIDS